MFECGGQIIVWGNYILINGINWGKVLSRTRRGAGGQLKP